MRHISPISPLYLPYISPISPLDLPGALWPEMRNQCVNALYLLCKINRSRQEEAAVAGVLSPLKEIISQVAG